MRIRIFMDEDDLARAAAEEIATWLRLAIPNATIGLAGGTTPLRTYQLLRHESLGWSSVTGWMTDERFVPVSHPDSNTGMVRRALFDHVPARLLEVPHVEDDPAASAARYDTQLGELLGTRPGLVLLGLGDDGHTASLFPGTDGLEVTEGRFVANRVDALDSWRLTATLPFLAGAARTMFIVAGDSKADVVADILERDVDHPATRVTQASRDVTWLLDRKAAARLSA